MRVLCDTNVLVRAVISPQGPAAEFVRAISHGHALVVSLPILGELYDVLRRPQIRKLHKLPDARIRRVISGFSKLATVVQLPATIPATVPHDPKDDPIVMTAIAGKVEVLCTLDHHLHETAVTALCMGHGIRVLRDVELLAELGTGKH